MDKSGIRIIGPGDLTDDDELPGMTDAMLGIVTAHHYSAVHDSALNKAYVADFEKAYGKRPNFVSVGGYDAMHLIFEALKKTGGKTDGDALVAAMKGMKWESPRGPIAIDPRTRDVVHNEYIRRVERVDGQLSNVEFETYPMVKDPRRRRRSSRLNSPRPSPRARRGLPSAAGHGDVEASSSAAATLTISHRPPCRGRRRDLADGALDGVVQLRPGSLRRSPPR